MKAKLVIITALLAISTLSGCNKDQSSAPRETSKIITADNFYTITTMQWILEEMHIEGKPYPLESEKPYLTFQTDGKITGHTTINRFFGQISIDSAGTVTFPKAMGSTRMAGPEKLMNQEIAFMTALPQITSIIQQGIRLHLTSADKKTKLIFYLPVE